MSKTDERLGAARAEGEATAEGHRGIQAKVDKGEKNAASESKEPMQAGQRDYPSEFPATHLKKPGLEADLTPRPMYEAPGYRGSEKLQGKAALITGGDSGIGRAVAVLYAREGADVAIVYLSEHEDAEETRRAVEQEGRRCILIPGDVADAAFCKDAVEKTIAEFGKLDILVTTPPSRSMSAIFSTSPTSISTAQSRPISMAIFTWPAKLCGI
jgi:hypothetical protein